MNYAKLRQSAGAAALAAALSAGCGLIPAQAASNAGAFQVAQASSQNGDAALSPEEIAKRKLELLKKKQHDDKSKAGGGGNGAASGNGGNGTSNSGTGGQKPLAGQKPTTGGSGSGAGTATGGGTGNGGVVKPLTSTGGASGQPSSNLGSQGNSPGSGLVLKHGKDFKPTGGGTGPGSPAMNSQNAPANMGATLQGGNGAAGGAGQQGGTFDQPTDMFAKHKRRVQPHMVPDGTVVAPSMQAQQPGGPAFLPKLGAAAGTILDLQHGRTQHSEDGGKRTVIEEPGNRTIVQQDGHNFIRHDDAGRFGAGASSVKTVAKAGGVNVTIFDRPGGGKVFNEVDGSGRLLRRYRRDSDGHEINLIDNRDFLRTAVAVGVGALIAAAIVELPPPHIDIPRDRYALDYDHASRDDLIECLTAPPVERLERRYSLDEILYSHDLRERMRHIDLTAVTFDSGAWTVDPQQYPLLERVADAMKLVIGRQPGEVFLIEGHTDAVGRDIDNLSLSDRRAEEVARILSEVFRVPAENLVTQGYGEQFLKIDTSGPERANRRVVVRRITPLMAQR